jgi:hypothetical protein
MLSPIERLAMEVDSVEITYEPKWETFAVQASKGTASSKKLYTFLVADLAYINILEYIAEEILHEFKIYNPE